MDGILLINPVLTVERGIPNSHAGHGWERFTLRVIDALDKHPDALIFLLWGAAAKSYANRINPNRHLIIQADHPASVLYHPGSKWNSHYSFTSTNAFLKSTGRKEIDW